MVCEVIVSQCPPKHFIYNKQIEYDLFSNSIVSILRQPFVTLPFEICKKCLKDTKTQKTQKIFELKTDSNYSFVFFVYFVAVIKA